MLRGVDVKPAYLVFLCFLRGSAAQQRLYAGDKLHGAEWLCNVVVGAAVKTYHLIILRALRGQHYNRKPRILWVGAQLRQYLHAVLLGEHYIQQQDRRRFLLQSRPELARALEALCL